MNKASSPKSCQSLAIVLPVYRNEASLSELTQRLVKACSPIGITLQIIFVDDASPDNSSAVIHKLQRTYKDIEIHRHKVNQGQQESIRTGLKVSSSDYVVVMDADLQDPPELIPRLCQAMAEQKASAIFAVRSNHYQSTGRMNTSRVFKWLMRQMVNLPRGAGCFVLLDRKMVTSVLALQTRHFYLPGLVCKTKLEIGTLGFERHERVHGQSSYNPTMRLKTAVSNIKCLLE